MFSITHNNVSNIIEITNSEEKVFGKIHLNDGGSLQELTINSHALIKDLSPLEYKNTYASSILFPFANRINDGAYTFNDETFQFPINEAPNNNALHGLVFNKIFEVIEKISKEDMASIKLKYNETEKSIGFPFTYSIELEYTITATNLDLKITVANTDTKPFPFTLG